MNKKIVKALALLLLAFVLPSCSTLRYFELIPTFNITSLKMTGLDLDGMDFELSYRIDNPYPVEIRVKELDLDVLYFDEEVIKVDTFEPFEIRSQRVSKQKLHFKVPYEKIISLTKTLRGKKSVTCTLHGGAYLDYASYGAVLNKIDPKLPILYTFTIPIMKPSFSVSNISFVPPSLTDLKAGLSFDLTVEEKGYASWECSFKNCALKDGENNLIELKVPQDAVINSSNKTVKLSAEIDPVSAASFIAKLIKKEGSNPVFSADAEFIFLNSSYNYTVPLSYSKELRLSDF